MRGILIGLVVVSVAVAAVEACDGGAAIVVDLAMQPIDQAADLPQRVCTTPECAAAPCTSGCVFAHVAGDCPMSDPVQVDSVVVRACAGFCGFPSMSGGQPLGLGEPSPSGSCGHYDYSLAGACQASPCNFNPGCYVVDASYPANGAVICPTGSTCYDNSQGPIGDLAISCGDLGSAD